LPRSPCWRQVRERDQRQRGREIYSLHAPEVGCIGARHTGVATLLKHSKGGQFVAQFKGNPYDDGHTLATVIAEMKQTG
jgi:transposase, IS5 family